MLGNAVSSLFESVFVMIVFTISILIVKSDTVYLIALPCVAVLVLTTVMAVIWGMFLNSLFLFSRDTNFLFTVLEEPMEIFSGVKVPTTLFPVWAKAISVIFPLTYAIEAVRRVRKDTVPEDLIVLMKALADETRLKLLREIHRQPASTQALAELSSDGSSHFKATEALISCRTGYKAEEGELHAVWAECQCN